MNETEGPVRGAAQIENSVKKSKIKETITKERVDLPCVREFKNACLFTKYR